MPEEKETINLDQMQVLELEQIILDKDKEAALKFLQDHHFKRSQYG